MPDWTFLTNHAHALVCIARDPGIRTREIAAAVGITERATQRIVSDLVAAGYITVTREGRRNRYQLNPTLPLRHPLEREHQIGEILAIFHSDNVPKSNTKPEPPTHPHRAPAHSLPATRG
ncbi:helix-turn-helix transcriptional regulator [Nonomuraea dietziae]|uniref:helix-turn-helix transcriptional regulator n=1 Tax=Nonomuraea dietziae TaxID=65515 RepID=UPI00342ACBB1